MTFESVPYFPKLTVTRDAEVSSQPDAPSFFRSILAPDPQKLEIKLPVRYKINSPNPMSLKVLIRNKHGESLAGYVKHGDGQVVFLPEYESVEDSIIVVAERVLPSLLPNRPNVALLEKFVSAEERSLLDQLQLLEERSKQLMTEVDEKRNLLRELERHKVARIEQDGAAKLIIRYLKLATENQEVALFHLYKAVEVIEKRFGSENKAKAALSDTGEIKLIGKVANASYGDIRHAPDPNDIAKPWTEADISKCFEAAESLSLKYFEWVIQNPDDTPDATS